MTNLYSCADEMVNIWHSISAAWNVAYHSWRDTDRDKFEREHIRVFAQATNAYIASLKRLAGDIEKICHKAP